MAATRRVCLSFAGSAIAAVSLSASPTTFVLLEVPGHSQTIPAGVNERGDVVGTAIRCTVDPVLGDLVMASRGFVHRKGEFTVIEIPGAGDGPVLTDINAAGTSVGYFTDADGVHGFTLRQGRIDPLGSASHPGLRLVPQGINARGDIVGWIPPDGTDGYRAFVMEEGEVSILGGPAGAFGMQAWGINTSGVVVGTGFAPGPGPFSFRYRRGALSMVPLAGLVIDINDRGDLLAEVPGRTPPSAIYRKGSGGSGEDAAGEHQVTDIANTRLVGIAPQPTLPNGCAHTVGFMLRWN